MVHIERPVGLKAVLEALAQPDTGALAGGTNVMVDIKKKREKRCRFVSIDTLDELKKIEEKEDDQVFGRNTAVLKYHIACVRCADTHFVFLITCTKARGSRFHKKHGHAFCAFGLICQSSHTVECRHAAIGDKAFPAV